MRGRRSTGSRSASLHGPPPTRRRLTLTRADVWRPACSCAPRGDVAKTPSAPPGCLAYARARAFERVEEKDSEVLFVTLSLAHERKNSCKLARWRQSRKPFRASGSDEGSDPSPSALTAQTSSASGLRCSTRRAFSPPNLRRSRSARACAAELRARGRPRAPPRESRGSPRRCGERGLRASPRRRRTR
jgi:hypothetical protein